MSKKIADKQKGLRTFLSFLKGCRPYMGAAVAACLFTIACEYLTPQIIRFAVDNVLGDLPYPDYLSFLPDRDFFLNAIYLIAVAIGITAAARAAANYFMRSSAARAGEKLSMNLKNRLFRHIQSLPFSWHSSVQTGDIIQRSTQDADVIKRFVVEQTTELFRTTLMIGAGLALMFLMHPQLSLVTVGFLPVILIFSAVFFSKISRNFKKADEAEGALSAVLQENLTGARVVRAFGAQAREREKFENKGEVYVSFWIRLGRALSVYWASGDMLAGMQTLTVLVAGVYFTASGSLSPGSFITFMFYNQMLVWPVRNMGRILGEVSKTAISSGRIREILDAAPEDEGGGYAGKVTGAIKFENVTFSYDGKRNVLQNVSFDLPAGKTLGIMGGTGSGKSAAAHLLNRLYDATEGAVYIDGVNVREYSRAHLRRNVGVILQEPFLFSRTISANIAISERETRPDEVRAAARIANVDEAVTSFEKGYETLVGERGVSLSGGQKQRVAIARTLIQRPPVVVFDDSLSAVDTATDKQIRRSLAEHLKGTTAVIISHRITTVMNADKIIVLSDGKIEEEGAHGQLLARGGLYKKIYDLQTAGITEPNEKKKAVRVRGVKRAGGVKIKPKPRKTAVKPKSGKAGVKTGKETKRRPK